jgi:hypothetical protein
MRSCRLFQASINLGDPLKLHGIICNLAAGYGYLRCKPGVLADQFSPFILMILSILVSSLSSYHLAVYCPRVCLDSPARSARQVWRCKLCCRPAIACLRVRGWKLTRPLIRIRKDSGLIFPFAGSVLVCGREQLLL